MKKKKIVKKAVVNSNQPINPEDSTIVGPKYHFANQIRELFKRDPEIKMEFDELKCILDMEVDNEIKCLAIRRLLPETKEFVDGKITINVKLRHDRFGGDKFLKDTVYEAFKGNPLFDYMYEWVDKEHCTNPYCWVSMSSEPIFYPESNLHNVWGDSVNLPEELATIILPDQTDFIYYCSSNPNREMPEENSKKFNI